MSTFTPNKSIEQPASGSYVDSWATPVNADWGIIDTAFGGVTSISVTGAASNITLTTAEYQPPNIEVNGVLSVNLVIFVPGGVGGFWSVSNNTTGAHTLAFNCAAGGGVTITQGQRAFVICDGTNVALAQTLSTSFSNITGQIATSQVPVGAVSQYQGLLSIAGTQITGGITASQIASGTIANARLPNPGVGPGVTIALDPGTTPSGAAGDIFYYY